MSKYCYVTGCHLHFSNWEIVLSSLTCANKGELPIDEFVTSRNGAFLQRLRPLSLASSIYSSHLRVVGQVATKTIKLCHHVFTDLHFNCLNRLLVVQQLCLQIKQTLKFHVKNFIILPTYNDGDTITTKLKVYIKV